MSELKTFASAEALTRAASYFSRNRGDLKSCKTVKDFEQFLAKMDGFTGFKASENYKEALILKSEESGSESVGVTESTKKILLSMWYDLFPYEIKLKIDRMVFSKASKGNMIESVSPKSFGQIPFLVSDDVGCEDIINWINLPLLTVDKFQKFVDFYADYFDKAPIKNAMELFGNEFDEEASDYLQSIGYDLYEVEIGVFNTEEDPGTPVNTFTIVVIEDCEGRAKEVAQKMHFDMPLYSGEVLSVLCADCIDSGKSFYREVFGSAEDFAKA